MPFRDFFEIESSKVITFWVMPLWNVANGMNHTVCTYFWPFRFRFLSSLFSRQWTKGFAWYSSLFLSCRGQGMIQGVFLSTTTNAFVSFKRNFVQNLLSLSYNLFFIYQLSIESAKNWQSHHIFLDFSWLVSWQTG